MNSVKDRMRDGLLAEFFKVTENLPQSIWRSADGGEFGDNKENKSTPVPDSICDLMELATGVVPMRVRLEGRVEAWRKKERKGLRERS